MKILVAEKIADKGLDILRDAGYDVVLRYGITADELVAEIGEYDALIVRSATYATREVIEAGTNLKIIGRAGVGIDNVDVTAATERGVIVCNAPTSNVISAAEQTMALLLSIARKTPQAQASMKSGKWDRSKFSGNELYQKTLAIFGLGRIGGLVAERARAFEMRLIGYDPYCSEERASQLGVEMYDKLEDILPQADYITVHLPRTPETIGMFDTEQFAAMKDGVYLVNTARGGIYNVKALASFIAAGKIAGAGIDVFEKEPCTSSPLHELDNVVLTPHLGATTKEAQVRAGVQIAEYVLMGLEGKMVPTAVNVELVPENVLSAVGPYIEACQLAGVVLAQMSPEPISALTLNVYGDLADYEVGILGTSALRGIFSNSLEDPVNLVNASYIAEQRGVNVTINCDKHKYEYSSEVSLTVRSCNRDIEIGLTISGPKGNVRIVSVFGYRLDLIPRSNILILKYEDTPGKLGKIGTVLGNANINITTMEIGLLEDDQKEAIVLMNVSEAINDRVFEELKSVVGVVEGWRVNL